MCGLQEEKTVEPDWYQTIFQEFQDIVPMGVQKCVVGGRGEFLYVSDGYLRLTGYTRQELDTVFQGDFYRMVYEEDRKMIRGSAGDQLRSGGLTRLEYRLKAKDGRLLWVLEYGRMIGDQNGESRFYCIVFDVTEQMKSRLALEVSRNRLEKLINTIPGGVSVLTFDGKKFRIDYASDGFYRLFGYTREEYARLPETESGMKLALEENRDAVRDEVRNQLAGGGMVTSEYMIRKKDGGTAWVSMRGNVLSQKNGVYEIQSVFIDNTVYKKVLEDAKIDEERYRIIESVLEDILFEYDIAADVMNYSGKFTEMMGYGAVIRDYTSCVTKNGLVHHSDVPVFLRLMDHIRKGITDANAIIRLRHRDGKYYWYHSVYTIIFDGKGRPAYAIGKAINIDRQKQEMLELLEKTQRDPSTMLYNKTTTEMLAKQYLEYESDCVHALMVIDIDNFKKINDTMGHLFGDAVLIEVAQRLRDLFEKTDVVGRIGGDEFLVLLRGDQSREIMEGKAQSVCGAFRSIRLPVQDNFQITASIGMAVYPSDGPSYQELFQKADKALYHLKHGGEKNRYAFYEDTMMEEPVNSVQKRHPENLPAADGTDGFYQKMVSGTLDILFGSPGEPGAVDRALALIGCRFQVSRVYVFENSEDNLSCSNTYEWCAEGVASMKDSLQDFLYSEIGSHDRRFDRDGLFYCYDIGKMDRSVRPMLERQGIVSTIHCGIYEKGVFRGYVGCDNCFENRKWLKSEIDAFSAVSKIIGGFLLLEKKAGMPRENFP